MQPTDEGGLSVALGVLTENRVLDVLVPGYATRDWGVLEFRPQPRSVYLQLSAGFLRLQAVGQFDQLSITPTERPALDEVLVDPDDEPAVVSLALQLFQDAYTELSCTAVHWYTDSRSEPGIGVVKCALFELERSFLMFADPTYPFGIHIGGREEWERWLVDDFDADHMRSHEWRRLDQ